MKTPERGKREYRMIGICGHGKDGGPRLMAKSACALIGDTKHLRYREFISKLQKPPREVRLENVDSLGGKHIVLRSVPIWPSTIYREGLPQEEKFGTEHLRGSDVVVVSHDLKGLDDLRHPDIKKYLFEDAIRKGDAKAWEEYLRVLQEHEQRGTIVHDDFLKSEFVKDREKIIAALKRARGE